MSRKIKVSIILLIIGFVITLLACFNEVFGDIGGPGGISTKSWEYSLDSLLLNGWPMISCLLLFISIWNKNIVLRRVAYAIMALLGSFEVFEVFYPEISYESGYLSVYMIIGFAFLSVAAVLLFVSAKNCGMGMMIAIIICIVASLAGIFTILYVFPLIAGLLINRDCFRISLATEDYPKEQESQSIK